MITITPATRLTPALLSELLSLHRQGRLQERIAGGGQGPWYTLDPRGVWFDFWIYEYREKPQPREWSVWVDPMGVISQFGNHSGRGVATQIKVREVL